jgi:ZIP family zinc transporter
MLEAGFWGLVGGAALIVGAAAGLLVRVPFKVIGLVMAFGVGVLFSAVAFELTAEAYDRAGADAVVIGMFAGAVVFFAGDSVIDRYGGHRRKDPAGTQEDASGPALLLGALLDGIPESAAIGMSLVGGGGVGIPFVAAVFLSNVPEGVSATVGMKKRHSPRYILGMWVAVTVASALAAMLGYAVLGGAGDTTHAVVQSFAAGAILTMLTDTMVPEATKHADKTAGLVTALGFTCAFLLSMA